MHPLLHALRRRHRRPRPAVRGGRPRRVRRQRRRPAAPRRRQRRCGWRRSRSAAVRSPTARWMRACSGILAFTLPEALWLAGNGAEDVVVAYPTVDRAALRELADGPARERVTVMVDCREQLDLIPAGAGPVRVCIDVDAGWWPLGGRVRIGAKRSPLRTPEQAAALAREIVARPGLRAGRAADVRGADRRRRRPRPATRCWAPPCARCSAPRRASWRPAAPPSWRPCVPSRRCGSSTAAAPARSSAPRPSRR